MFRTISLPGLAISPHHFLLLVLSTVAGTACARNTEITNPAEAVKDADFGVQGEYQGKGTWDSQDDVTVGAQVIALGSGQFKAVVTKGGLPGDGWQRGEPRFELDGKRSGDTTALGGPNFVGKIAGKLMTLGDNEGKTKLELKRIVRRSPSEGAKPPEGAVVLFDGSSADNFEHGTLLPDGNLLSEATTKQAFGDYTLHIEFRLSYMPEAREQARSNSGVYLHDCYEIQVLDSFGLEGADNECGGFYQLRRPDVNMCFPPLCWQTYDIIFVAPKYKGDKKVANARVEVRHNGVVVHPPFELAHATPGRQPEGPPPRPFYLQGHGNKIEYRNIWLKQ
jgi:hypothetical protein